MKNIKSYFYYTVLIRLRNFLPTKLSRIVYSYSLESLTIFVLHITHLLYVENNGNKWWKLYVIIETTLYILSILFVLEKEKVGGQSLKRCIINIANKFLTWNKKKLEQKTYSVYISLTVLLSCKIRNISKTWSFEIPN